MISAISVNVVWNVFLAVAIIAALFVVFRWGFERLKLPEPLNSVLRIGLVVLIVYVCVLLIQTIATGRPVFVL